MKNLSRLMESSVFQKLKNVPLSQLTQQDYQRMLDNVYIQSDNLEFISDLSQVMKFSEKPRGLQECTAQQSGSINSSTKVTLLEIPERKTFDLQSVVMFTAVGDSVIDYWLSGIPPAGLDYLVKTVEFNNGDRGVSVDFSTMGDFLISGTQDGSVFLKASRFSGSGSVAAHNVFFREVN